LNRLRGLLELDIDKADRTPRLAKQRNLWRAMRRGARDSLDKKLLLVLVRV
jgi:hypothetical protein